MLAIDHVLLPVRDLALAASEIESRYGLASIEGGRHPAWGTANRIRLLSLEADPVRLEDWLGEHHLPLAVATGPSRVSAVVLRYGHRDFPLIVQGLPAEASQVE